MKTSITTFAATTLTAAVLLALVPGRAAADPGAIFVSNYNGANGYVSAYSATGAAATGYTTPTGFSNAEGVAYNPVSGMLYLADFGQNQIRTFNAANGTEAQIGFANAAGLSNPYGLALNAGVLYVANYGPQTVTAYNAATGATVTSGFTSPTGLSRPIGLAVNATTLFVVNSGNNTLGAFNLATGAAVFSITGLTSPRGVALFGNDLFVANSGSANTVGEYNATTGAVINASFVTGLSSPVGLAVLGNRLLVANESGNTVGAYGIPDVATSGNVPTSTNASFLTGLNGPDFIAVVPEPSACALLGVGAAALGVALLRRRWTVRAQAGSLPACLRLAVSAATAGRRRWQAARRFLTKVRWVSNSCPQTFIQGEEHFISGGLAPALSTKSVRYPTRCLPMKKLLLTPLAAASLSLPAARLHAQMLLNGSFENPAITGTSAPGSGANWTAGGGNTSVLTNGNGTGTTPYGTQYVYLFTGSTDAQTVSSGFTLNQTYTFSLSAAAFSTGATQLRVAISGGATASQSFALPANTTGGGSTAIPFVTYSLAFTPTTSTAVTFTLTDIGTSALDVDNVQLVVPEPSTWALLAVGAGALGLALRRRHAAAVAARA